MKPSVCYRDLGTPFITAEDYDEAINALLEAKKQLSPDGNICLVCGDGGHQAWECRHNPMAMARMAARELQTYRCFHCGQAFIDIDEAADHFGRRDEREFPFCCT